MLRLIANTFYAGYKVPQVYNIYKTKSVAGLSIVSVAMELVSLMFATAYHFRTQHSLIAFADCVSFLVCNLVIFIQFNMYNNNENKTEKKSDTSKSILKSLLFASFWFGGVVFLCQATSLIPMIWINILKAITAPLMTFSQIPQIITILMQNSTGAISTSSVMIHFLAATILAFSKRPSDPVLALGYHVAFALDLILIFQIMIFNAPSRTVTATPTKPSLSIQTTVPTPLALAAVPVAASQPIDETVETTLITTVRKSHEAEQLAAFDAVPVKEEKEEKEEYEDDEQECRSPL